MRQGMRRVGEETEHSEQPSEHLLRCRVAVVLLVASPPQAREHQCVLPSVERVSAALSEHLPPLGWVSRPHANLCCPTNVREIAAGAPTCSGGWMAGTLTYGGREGEGRA